MTPLPKLLFKISKVLHKYVGLVGLVYFVMMGVSGILLNHPDLLRPFSLPMRWMPPSYHYSDWNRMALREAVFSPTDPGTLFVGGKNGVWQSHDDGRSFRPMGRGFPTSAYDRETRCLLFDERGATAHLYAGTRTGLYRYDFDRAHWERIAAGLPPNTEIVDLVRAGKKILVFTPTAGYKLTGLVEKPQFQMVPLVSATDPDRRIRLFRFLLKLHDGSVLGLPGRLLMDLMAMALIFLSLSAIYIWYIPWRARKLKQRRTRTHRLRFFYKYHLKFGIYTALFLIIFALTGMFVRPPLLLAIAGYSVPVALLDDDRTNGAWPSRITRATYLAEENTLLLATRDGFFAGPPDGSRPFTPYRIDVPVHGMGVNVLEPLAGQRLLIGSFSGVYVWNSNAQSATDVHGKPLFSRRSGPPGAMAAGAVVCRGEVRYWADYRRGLQSITDQRSSFTMPHRMVTYSSISLWHFLFEIHNGRIFRDWMGTYVSLIVPFGSLVLVMTSLAGVYDWVYRKAKKRKYRPNKTT